MSIQSSRARALAIATLLVAPSVWGCQANLKFLDFGEDYSGVAHVGHRYAKLAGDVLDEEAISHVEGLSAQLESLGTGQSATVHSVLEAAGARIETLRIARQLAYALGQFLEQLHIASRTSSETNEGSVLLEGPVKRLTGLSDRLAQRAEGEGLFVNQNPEAELPKRSLRFGEFVELALLQAEIAFSRESSLLESLEQEARYRERKQVIRADEAVVSGASESSRAYQKALGQWRNELERTVAGTRHSEKLAALRGASNALERTFNTIATRGSDAALRINLAEAHSFLDLINDGWDDQERPE